MAAWSLQEAETSAKKVFEMAFDGEPQIVMRNGMPSLVIVSFADFNGFGHAEVPPETGKGTCPGNPVDALLSCPYDISGLIDDREGFDLPSEFERSGGF